MIELQKMLSQFKDRCAAATSEEGGKIKDVPMKKDSKGWALRIKTAAAELLDAGMQTHQRLMKSN